MLQLLGKKKEKRNNKVNPCIKFFKIKTETFQQKRECIMWVNASLI